MKQPLYPKDYNPPNKGKCERCGSQTRAWDPKWLRLCPVHWQELIKGGR